MGSVFCGDRWSASSWRNSFIGAPAPAHCPPLPEFFRPVVSSGSDIRRPIPQQGFKGRGVACI